MRSLDPAERARREESVAVIRGFVPIYAGMSLLLFAPALLRWLGLPAPTGTAQSTWSAALLLGLILAAAWLIQRLAGLGQYRVGAGLRFDLMAALTRGEYVPVGHVAPETPTVTSPLEVLRSDATELAPALTRAGEPLLSETVLAGLTEAETVARLLELHDRRPEGLPIDAARAAIGRYTDHLLALRTDLQRGTVVAVEHLARFEADLRALREVADALRRGPAAAATGSD